MSDASPPPADRDALLKEALGQHWYHVIEIAPGVFTDGDVDHKEMAPKLLPADLKGKRALDVATFDGYWAFELEKRGAQTAAIDLARFEDTEIPYANRERILGGVQPGEVPGLRFGLAKQLLSSGVERVECPVYDLTPERIGGKVDYAVLSDLLIHLADPVRALIAVRESLNPGGRLLLSEEINVPLSVLRPRRPSAEYQSNFTNYNWWHANTACLKAWLIHAGFTEIRRVKFFKLKARRLQDNWHLALEARVR